MPRLTLQRSHGVYLLSLQHPRGPSTTRWFSRARACITHLTLLPLPETELAGRSLQNSVRAILNAGWPALLVALSSLLTTNLSNSIFGDILQ